MPYVNVWVEPEELPKAEREDAFTIFGVRVRCYILDDGRRVLNVEDVHELFAKMEQGGPHDPDELMRFAAWQASLN